MSSRRASHAINRMDPPSVVIESGGGMSRDHDGSDERAGLLGATGTKQGVVTMDLSPGPSEPAKSPASPPSPPPPAPVWAKYIAFFALVVIQVSLAMSFKAAQGPTGAYPFNPAALLILSEFVKMCMSTSAFYFSVPAPTAQGGGGGGGGEGGSGGVAAASAGAAPPPSRLSAAIAQFKSEAFGAAMGGMLPLHASGLALLYCVNNNITFVIFQMADGGNINLIKAGSTFVSAFILWQVLGRKVSKVQWGAILIQSAALIITQFGANCKNANTPVLPIPTYLALLVSLTITACSSVWNEKVLKDSGAVGASMNSVNVIMYGAGTLLNVGVHVATGGSLGPAFFHGMGQPASLLVLLCNSLIGIAVVAVYKYADAVVKSFASACSTAVLFIIGAVFFDVPVNVVVVAGCVCIFTATQLYTNNPEPVAGGGGASSGGGSSAPPPAAAAAPATSGAAATAPPEASSSSSSSGGGGGCLSQLYPQTTRDYVTLSICGVLILVVLLEPTMLKSMGGRRLAGGVGCGVGEMGVGPLDWATSLLNSKVSCFL